MNRVKTLLTKGALLALGLASFTGSVHADRRAIAAVGGGGIGGNTEVKVIDARTGSILSTRDRGGSVANDTTFAVKWSSCGNYLLSAGDPVSGPFTHEIYSINNEEIGLPEVTGDAGAVVIDASWRRDSSFYALAYPTGGAGTLDVWSFDKVSTTTLVSTATPAGLTSARAVSWRPNEKHIAVGGSSDGDEVRIFPVDDAGTLGTELTSTPHGALVRSVDWSRDGKFLAIGGDDSGGTRIRVYSFDDTSLTELDTETAAGFVNGVAWAPNGKSLASADSTGTVRIYSFDGVSLVEEDSDDVGGTLQGQDVAWYPDSRGVIFVGNSSSTTGFTTAYGYDAAQGSLTEAWSTGQSAFLASVDIQPLVFDELVSIANGNKLLVNDICPIAGDGCYANEDGTTRFSGNVQVADGKTLCTDQLLTNNIACKVPLQVLIGGDTSSSGPDDGKELRVLDAEDGTILRSGDHGTGVVIVNSSKYSPDGKFIASGGNNSGGTGGLFLRIYSNSTTLIELDSFDHGNTINSVDWSSDGGFVAIAGNNGTDGFEVRVFSWDGTTLGTPINYENTDVARSVSWSPDGSFLAVGDGTASAIGHVRVLEFAGSTLTLVDTFDAADVTGDLPRVHSVDWSPDGNFIAMGSNDKTDGDLNEVRVLAWDESITTLSDFTGASGFDHGDRTTSVAWSPSGQYVAMSGETGTGSLEVRVLEFDEGAASLAEVATFDHGDTVEDVAWYPDGTRLVMGGITISSVNVRGLNFDPTLGTLTSFFDVDHGANIFSVDAIGGDSLCIECPEIQLKGDVTITGCVVEDLKIEPDNKILVNFIDPVMIDESTGECIEDPDGTTCFSGNVAVSDGKKLFVNEICSVGSDCESDPTGIVEFCNDVCILGDLVVKGDFDAPPGPQGNTGPAGPTGPQGPEGVCECPQKAIGCDCGFEKCAVTSFRGNLAIDDCCKLLVNFIDPVRVGGTKLEEDDGTEAITCFSGNVGLNECRSLLVNRICPVMDVTLDAGCQICDVDDRACEINPNGCLELYGDQVIIQGKLLVNEFGPFDDGCLTKDGLPLAVEPMRFNSDVNIVGDLHAAGVNVSEMLDDMMAMLRTQKLEIEELRALLKN